MTERQTGKSGQDIYTDKTVEIDRLARQIDKN